MWCRGVLLRVCYYNNKYEVNYTSHKQVKWRVILKYSDYCYIGESSDSVILKANNGKNYKVKYGTQV